MKKPKQGPLKIAWKFLIRKTTRFILWFLIITIGWVFLYRFINPPFTSLMAIRYFQSDSDDPRCEYQWVDMEEIAQDLPFAAIAAEDQRFAAHSGFDFKAIQAAIKHNQSGKGSTRGASTISQQVAKNVFLWPGRSWLRKGFEVYFTFLIEFIWGKERILEVYLNVIEMGSGIYGAEAAATHHYSKAASELSRAEAAMLVATFPNPRIWQASEPTEYLYKRQRWIMQQMRFIQHYPLQSRTE